MNRLLDLSKQMRDLPFEIDSAMPFLDVIRHRLQDVYKRQGVNTSYVDYAPDGFSLKNISTPFDIELEQVVDYLEEQMEIKHE